MVEGVFIIWTRRSDSWKYSTLEFLGDNIMGRALGHVARVVGDEWGPPIKVQCRSDKARVAFEMD